MQSQIGVLPISVANNDKKDWSSCDSVFFFRNNQQGRARHA